MTVLIESYFKKECELLGFVNSSQPTCEIKSFEFDFFGLVSNNTNTQVGFKCMH